MPQERGGGQHTFTPLHRCWTVGWHLGHVAIVHVSTMLGPWGLLVTWPGVPSVSSSALGVATRRCGSSGVVACAGCEGCVTCLCATPQVWLC